MSDKQTDNESWLDEDYSVDENAQFDPIIRMAEMRPHESINVEFVELDEEEKEEIGPQGKQITTKSGGYEKRVFIVEVESVEGSIPHSKDGPVVEGERYQLITSANTILGPLKEIALENGESISGHKVNIGVRGRGDSRRYQVEAL